MGKATFQDLVFQDFDNEPRTKGSTEDHLSGVIAQNYEGTRKKPPFVSGVFKSTCPIEHVKGDKIVEDVRVPQKIWETDGVEPKLPRVGPDRFGNILRATSSSLLSSCRESLSLIASVALSRGDRPGMG